MGSLEANFGPFGALLTYAQWIIGAAWAIVALWTGWAKEDIPRERRALLVLGIALGVIFAWPSDFGECSLPSNRTILACVFGVLAASAGVLHAWIDSRHTYQQLRQEEDHQVTRKIVGGTELTDEAFQNQTFYDSRGALRTRTEQEVFDVLGCDPLRMWDRSSRARMRLVYEGCYYGFVLLGTLAMVCGVAAFISRDEIRRAHQNPRIDPQEVSLRSGQWRRFSAVLQQCDPKVEWHIKPLVGEIDRETGIYVAPDSIPAEREIAIIGVNAEKPRDVATATVKLRAESGYVDKRKPMVGVDQRGLRQRFEVVMIDKRFSWMFGDITIAGGIDGTKFARSLAADGLFDSYEEVICVGAASREYRHSPEANDTEREAAKRREDERSRTRARVLAEWISAAVGPSKPVWWLKVGRYVSEERRSREQTSIERQVVLIGVPVKTKGINLESSVVNAFDRDAAGEHPEPLFRMYIENYPRPWQVERIR
jgi:hypothetical protein